MSLIDQVQLEMVAAMKSRSEARLSALRMLKSALMKQNIDAAEMFRKAGRTEQAEKEEAERALLEGYLPAGASEEEIDAAIAEAFAETGATSIKQMGVVMKAAQARLKAKTVDGKTMSDKVRAKLS